MITNYVYISKYPTTILAGFLWYFSAVGVFNTANQLLDIYSLLTNYEEHKIRNKNSQFTAIWKGEIIWLAVIVLLLSVNSQPNTFSGFKAYVFYNDVSYEKRFSYYMKSL